MSFKFRSQLQIDLIPDEALANRFEVDMPTMYITDRSKRVDEKDVTENQQFRNDYGISKLGYPYSPIVEEISFAPRGFSTSPQRVRTGWYKVPTDVEEIKDVTMTFFVSQGMLTQYYLTEWKKLIFNTEGEYYYPGWVYKKNIKVTFWGASTVVPVALMYLEGAFPKTQEDYKLSYNQFNQRLTLTAVFSVDNIKIKTSYIYPACASEIISGPVGAIGDIARNGLSSILGTSEEYDILTQFGSTDMSRKV